MSDGYSFPGRWVGGISLVLGPLMILAGLLLRIRYHYFFPQQLTAYAEQPRLMVAAYSLFTVGMVVLTPAVAALARIIGARRPGWAAWGAGLVILGLFTRTFHGGIDHLAFQLVNVVGADEATRIVGDTYGAWHAFRSPALAVVTGWTVLAIGAYRSGALSLPRAIGLGLMSMLALGTLKGTQIPQSLVAVAGLCYAFLPLGVRILRDGPRPPTRGLVQLSLLVAALILIHLYGPTG